MLEQSLTLTDLTLFGIMSIMGSGGFNLVGKGVRNGGSLWPLALAIAAVLLMGAAYAYAGAYERFKKNTSESDIIQSVFGEHATWVGSGAILVYGVVSIVVILVLCTQMMIPSYSWISQVGMTISMLGAMTYLSLLGIELDKSVVDILSWVLIGILAMITVIGGVGLVTQPMPSIGLPTHAGFMESLWMFFFILVGFDALMKFTEEAKDSKDIPTSFYLSNGISIALTIAMAVAVSLWLPNLSAANESMAVEHLVAKIFGDWILGPAKWTIILFLLATTFVVFLSLSRYLYGLGETIEWLAPMKDMNDAKAPWKAILSVFSAGSLVSIMNNIELLVKITDLGFAVIAALVAGAVSVADWRDGRSESATINGATGIGFIGLLASAFV